MEYSYNEIFTRSIRLIGEDAQERLHHAHAAVFGLGGVGSHTAEALARAGLGTLTLIEKDVVDISNINRQAVALTTTVGRPKTEVMAERIRQIHPQITLYSHKFFFLKPEDGAILSPQPDFIIDAIDNVTGKLALAEYARKAGIPMIMCLGTGNKLDPGLFQITDIYRTSVCPLAKVMRKELRSRNFTSMPVLFSTEPPLRALTPPGSISFVPPVAGYMLAGYAVRYLLGKEPLQWQNSDS